MKISVCVDAVFNGKDFIESMGHVKDAGLDAIEFWSWWDKDINAIRKAKEDLDMTVAAFCTRLISLVDASSHDDYMAGLKESIEVAKALGCTTLISQVGDERKDITRKEQHENLVKGLKACGPVLASAGVVLVIEPLNLVDHMGYYLSSSAEAFQIIDEVGSPHVKVLFDIYHQQIMEGNLIANITGNIDKIGHFHAAGVPGRHEITSGEIDYGEVFRAIGATGYDGYIGMEYFPEKDAAAGLRDLLSL